MQLELTKDNLHTYESIKSQILPFDAMFFRGSDLCSDLISVLEKYQVSSGLFTHIGVVVTKDILEKCKVDNGYFELEKDKIYLLESTFSYTNSIAGITTGGDVTTGKGKIGVQLREAEKVIPNYIFNEMTKVAFGPLINNPYRRTLEDTDDSLSERRKQLKEKFTLFFEDYHQRLYEINAIGLLSAIFPSLRLLRDTRDKIYEKLWKKIHKKATQTPIVNLQFCSELVGNVYQLIGVISNEFNTKNILPMDFFGQDYDRLPLIIKDVYYIKDWDLPNKSAIEYNFS